MDPLLAFGPFELHVRDGRLTRDGRIVPLQPLAFDLLAFAANHPGELLTRDRLLTELWPSVHVTDHSLTQLTHKVRHALGEFRGWFRTVPKRGFRFEAPVRALPAVAPRTDRRVPRKRDRFVGRGADLADLGAAIDQPGLVTLKGPGGVGKTRLALQAAAAIEDDGGVAVFCDLSAARSRSDVVRGLAAALDLELGEGDAVQGVATLGRALAALRRAVVVLDNLEQLVEHADLVGAWLDAAPQLRVLATSREPLRLAGERVLSVAPLPADDAAELLVGLVRARGLPPVERTAATRLAVRLDGLPLALELVASRLALWSADQVIRRLDDRTDPLPGGGEGRHGSLGAALAWSGALLDPVEREALAQLSVFRGPFSPEAAERVLDLPPSTSVVRVLTALVDHSLLEPTDTAAGRRLRMLATVREWASELGPTGAVEGRHAAWCASLADGPVGAPIEADLADLSFAVTGAVARGEAEIAAGAALAAARVLRLRGPIDDALALLAAVRPLGARRAEVAVTLAGVLRQAGRFDESRRAAQEALTLDPDRITRGVALETLALVAHATSPLPEALDRIDAALAHWRESGEEVSVGTSLATRAAVLRSLGRVDEALTHWEQAVAIQRRLGQRRLEAVALSGQGNLLRSLGREDAARHALERALEAAREVGDRGTEARTRLHLSRLSHAPDVALDHLRHALGLLRQVGDRRFEAVALGNIANTLRRAGRTEAAVRGFHDALDALREVNDLASVGATLAQLAELHRSRGELDAARTCLGEALALHEARGDAEWVARDRGLLGRVALDAGRPGEALALLDVALGPGNRDPITRAAFGVDRGAARAALGDPEGLEEVVAARDVLARAGVPEEVAHATARLAALRTAPRPV